MPDEDTWDAFVATVRNRFARLDVARPLFTTDAAGLADRFLDALPAERRQEHTCSTCRAFFRRYGGLVTLDDEGRATPVCWGAKGTPAPYRDAVEGMAAQVAAAKVTGVFLSADTAWGAPGEGFRSHLSLAPPAGRVFAETALRRAQAVAAERREDAALLTRALDAFPLAVVQQARTLLETGRLTRSEVALGQAAWLRDLHRRRDRAKDDRQRSHVVWSAVATAPPGFAHVGNNVLGTLLEDLTAGRPFEELAARFAAKLHPTAYQRPKAAPKAGNLARAEAIVAELASSGALARRFARFEDLEPSWTPRPRPGGGPVFGHLRPRREAVTEPPGTPAATVTWEKFCRTVLPEAAAIEVLVPTTGTFYALITAADPAAPPLFQWDSPDRRNPVSWYTYPQPAPATQWNLTAGTFVWVTAVTLMPSQWGGGQGSHHGDGVIFVLDGARDTAHTHGAGLFPEFLKPVYREIRSTIEAFSGKATIAGRDEAEGCGLGLRKGQSWDTTVRVTDADGVTTCWRLDRWD